MVDIAELTPDQAAWARYLASYHAAHPAITEQAFDHATDPSLGSPHDWLVAALPPRPGAVLDVACGSAPLQPRLREATCYLGIDLSAAELEEAGRRGRGSVTLGDARELPVPDASVDTVVSAMGVMLVQPVTAAVQEIARVLRPGGTAAFLLPAGGPLRPGDIRPLLSLVRHLGGPGSMPQRLTRRTLSPLLEAAGLTVVQAARHRFPFPLVTRGDARLAVRALYTPSRTPAQLAAAEEALARLARPGRHLPLPLLLVVARRR